LAISIIDNKLEPHQHNFVDVKDSDLKYNTFYDFNSSIYLTLNANNHILALNQQAFFYFETTHNQLIKESFLNCIHVNYHHLWFEQIALLHKEKQTRFEEFGLIKKNGAQRIAQLELKLLHGHLIKVKIDDITEKRAFDIKEFETKKRLLLINSLFQKTSEAIAGLNEHCDLMVYNEAFEVLFAKIFTTKLKPNLNIQNLLCDFPKLKMQEHLIKILAGEYISVIIENDVIENYYCFELIFCLIDAHCATKQIKFRIKELSSYKIAEHLRQKQNTKITEIGITNVRVELASALAHEINQPLTVIKAYSLGCLSRIKNLPLTPQLVPFINPLEQIAAHATQAGEIINQLKSFVIDGERNLQKCHINDIIDEALSFLKYELLESKVAVKLELMEQIPSLYLDKLQILQVILNLSRNSIESLCVNNIPSPQVIIRTEVKNQNLVVHFYDNGPGISYELKDKILNSHFTTKKNHSGLGLSICQSLIKAHEGELILTEYHNHKLWFAFKLPLLANLEE
ncbi:MAG: ATP-binding protein, partial [bacterium]|nr:ATP-binding protein [bacterium]